MCITDSAAQLVPKPMVSSCKIEFLLSRISLVRRAPAHAGSRSDPPLREPDGPENGQGSSTHGSVVGSRLVEGFSQRLGDQIGAVERQEKDIGCQTLTAREASTIYGVTLGDKKGLLLSAKRRPRSIPKRFCRK
jgi:hypothetical protein